jgi:hypothetical protein
MDGFRRMGNGLRSGIVSLAYRRLRRFGGRMRSGAVIREDFIMPLCAIALVVVQSL